jgi:hypothetical protein
VYVDGYIRVRNGRFSRRGGSVGTGIPYKITGRFTSAKRATVKVTSACPDGSPEQTTRFSVRWRNARTNAG